MRKHKYPNYIATRSGRKFNLKNPRPCDVDINDIATALSKVCRFTGHTKDFISVAQHCVNVAHILNEWGAPVEVQLYGLLHDAAESFLNDVVRPLKPYIPAYKRMEKKMMKVILKGLKLHKVLCLNRSQLELVKLADDSCALAERRDQINHGGSMPSPHFVSTAAVAWDKEIIGMEWREAKKIFEDTYELLTGAIQK